MGITIDEAIKVLEQYRQEHHSYPTDIVGKAEQLGVEALKRIKDYRKRSSTFATPLLPGETEE